MTHHLDKMIRYSRWEAIDLHERGRKPNVGDVMVVPLWRFLREHLVFGGWRDGQRGLVVATLGGCAALLKYAHLFALEWQKASTTMPCKDALSHQPPDANPGRLHHYRP